MAILNNGSGPAVKRIICGVTLQQRLALGSFSPTLLALLGHELQTGEAALTCTTPRQTVAVISTITMALLRTVRRATPLELEAMKRSDYTVEALRKEHLANHRMSDAEFKRMLMREGLARALDLIDDLTQPADKANGHAAPNGHANDNDNTGGDGSLPVSAQLSL